MPEESPAPDPIALTEALSRARGMEATMQFYAEDAVYDMSRVGFGIFEGRAAIRGFYEEWADSYEQNTEDEEMRELIDLGRGVVFGVARLSARPSGRPAEFRVQSVYGFVFVWMIGQLTRVILYTDLDEARAAAEGLVAERE
jgi:ketosteroid isomerase-like protein